MPRKTKAAILEACDEFTTGYLEAVLFTEDPDGTHSGDLEEITRAGLLSSLEDCKAFQELHAEDLEEYERITGNPASYAGHDFWLTRNRHGAGFWDRGAGEVGDRLTAAAHNFGEVSSVWWNGRLHLG